MQADLLPPLKPIPIKERLSILCIEYGHLNVLDSAFVVVDKNDVRTPIPVGGVACLILEPATRVSHAVCALPGKAPIWVKPRDTQRLPENMQRSQQPVPEM